MFYFILLLLLLVTLINIIFKVTLLSFHVMIILPFLYPFYLVTLLATISNDIIHLSFMLLLFLSLLLLLLLLLFVTPQPGGPLTTRQPA